MLWTASGLIKVCREQLSLVLQRKENWTTLRKKTWNHRRDLTNYERQVISLIISIFRILYFLVLPFFAWLVRVRFYVLHTAIWLFSYFTCSKFYWNCKILSDKLDFEKDYIFLKILSALLYLWLYKWYFHAVYTENGNKYSQTEDVLWPIQRIHIRSQ